MSINNDFLGPWEWDGPVWNYDKENDAPWLLDCHENPVLNGEIACRSESVARLIAAAPDLLAALRNLVIAADNLDPQSGIPIGYEQLIGAVTFADAAIAKATGAA